MPPSPKICRSPAEYEPLEVFQLIQYCFDKHWVPLG